MRTLWARSALGTLLFGVILHARAQVSLTTAVDLAIRNDPRIRMSQADIDRAKAAVSEAHDAYVPSVGANGGIGRSTGVPLGLPVIFSINASSLVYNVAQRDNLRAAHAGVQAASLSLEEMKQQVAEDTIDTYLALDGAQQRRTAITTASGFANRLVEIMQERFSAGQDAHLEVTKAQRTAAQLRLQALQMDDEIATLVDHLGRLTGLGALAAPTEHGSIPPIHVTTVGDVRVRDSLAVQAAVVVAKEKQYAAHAQKHYAFIPQLSFGANYSRISTAFTNYAVYYPAFNPENARLNGYKLSYNALSLGVQLAIPLFDLGHKARYREAAADAAHALADADNARNLFLEGELKLRHGTAELQAKAELSELDEQLAQDQLDTVLLQLQAGAGVAATPNNPLLTPKDEQNARLQERQRYMDVLAAQLDRDQMAIKLMRQNGTLEEWLRTALHTRPNPIAPFTFDVVTPQ